MVSILGAEEVAEEDRARRELEKDLGRKADEQVWNYLRDKSYLRERIDGFLNREKFANEYRKLEELGSGRRKRTTRSYEDPRMLALTQIIAVETANQPPVRDFRKRCLRNKLLEPEQVGPWIRRREARQGEPTVHRSSRGARAEILRYYDYTPGNEHQATATVNLNGPLGRLKIAATLVTDVTPWREPDAVTYILTGSGPPLPVAEWTLDPGPVVEIYPDDGDKEGDEGAEEEAVLSPLWPKGQMIDLRVNPRVSPARVAEIFRDARREALQGQTRGRPLTEKRAELGVFAAEHNDGRTWSELMGEWNRRHRDRRYKDVRIFSRDCRQAYERVTGKKLQWKGGRR